jgi:hypothetical protein
MILVINVRRIELIVKMYSIFILNDERDEKKVNITNRI